MTGVQTCALPISFPLHSDEPTDFELEVTMQEGAEGPALVMRADAAAFTGDELKEIATEMRRRIRAYVEQRAPAPAAQGQGS